MKRPFSAIVTTAAWRADAHAWIEARAQEHGVTITGPIDQTRVRPWSTQLVAPTSDGTWWFKANTSSMVFEAGLHALFAELLPDDVDEPVAVDAARGWVLTRDRGTTLGESHVPTAADWTDIVVQVARMQQLVAGHADRVLATGVPDCSPATVPHRFDRLLEIMGRLPDEHPARIDPDGVAELVALRPRVADAAALLAEAALPTTWQHGDLHPWNVFATADGLRIFDFGDGQWAAATEVLRVPQAWVTERHDYPWEPIAEAYFDAWGIGSADAAAVIAAATWTHPVNRALTWLACLEHATAQEWAEWGNAPAYHLQGVLAGGT